MSSARIDDADLRRLMRLLHGELSPEEARGLESRLAVDGELRAAYDRLAETWERLEAPPPGEVPAGFAAGVVAAARRLRDGDLSWSLAPVWARAGATVALAAGLLLGAAFDSGFAAPNSRPDTELAATDADAAPLSLAEVYWLALEESGGSLAEEVAGAAAEEEVR